MSGLHQRASMVPGVCEGHDRVGAVSADWLVSTTSICPCLSVPFTLWGGMGHGNTYFVFLLCFPLRRPSQTLMGVLSQRYTDVDTDLFDAHLEE